MATPSSPKRTFESLLFGLALLLMVLPVVVTGNEFMTQVLEKNQLYESIQEWIVPLEAKMMGALLLPLGYEYGYSATTSVIVVNGLPMKITWNCLGWQSFLLLMVSMLVGLRGAYVRSSVAEVIVLGALGTFWINIFRMLFTVLLALHSPAVFRVVFHDYLAAFVTVGWLIFFWWFSYAYVLERRRGEIDRKRQV